MDRLKERIEEMIKQYEEASIKEVGFKVYLKGKIHALKDVLEMIQEKENGHS